MDESANFDLNHKINLARLPVDMVLLKRNQLNFSMPTIYVHIEVASFITDLPIIEPH